MDTAFTACRDREKPLREYSDERGFTYSPTSFRSSSSEEFGERPPSRAGWYDGYEEARLADRYGDQVHEYENYAKVDQGCPSSQKYSRSAKRREWEYIRSESPKFKGRKARSLKPGTYHARSRRHQRVVAGWAEVFSTISEESSIEEAAQDACGSSSRPSTLETPTQRPHSVTEASSSKSRTRATLAASVSTSSDRPDLQFPEPLFEHGPLPGTSSATAMLEKQPVESGMRAASFGTLTYRADNNSSHEILKTQDSVDSAETFDGILLLRAFLTTLYAGLDTLSLQNLYAMLSDRPLMDVYLNEITEGGPTRPVDKDGEGPANAVTTVADKTGNVETHLHSAPNEKSVNIEKLGQPNRNCVLVLTVGLLVAVFFVASAFFVRSSFPFGVPHDQSPEKAANKVGLDANVTKMASKPRLVPVSNSAAALDRSGTSTKLSTSGTEKREHDRKTKMKGTNSVTGSSHVMTKLKNLSSVFGDSGRNRHRSSTNSHTSTESTTAVASFENEPSIVGDKDTFVYDTNDTKLDDDVF